MTAIITTTLYPSFLSSDPASSTRSSSKAPTTITHLITRTLASDIPTTIPLESFSAETKSSSAVTLGLSIGLPVGLFCLGLIAFLFYFYCRGDSFELNGTKTKASDYVPNNSNGKAWYPNTLYRRRCSGDNSSYSHDNHLPLNDFMSSKIRYNLRKPDPQHILTPKVPVYRVSRDSLNPLEVKDDVDTLLYSRPPNIYHIDSKMPSSNNLLNTSQTSIPNSNATREMDHEPLRKWNYQSPLSRWFLRSSTYLQDGFTLPVSIKTPTVQLKQLKILSRINKDYADVPQHFEDEKSPILEKLCDSSNSNHSPGSIGYLCDEVLQDPSSVLYGTINAQTFEVKDESSSKLSTMKLDPVPVEGNKKDRKRRERRQSRLRKHLKQISDVKPLPTVPKAESENGFHLGSVCKVIQEYTARLTDEINIEPGEFVKILATHTDGWCLVEKCTKDGNSKSLCDGNKSGSDVGYLNDDRGIIPGDCLQYN